MVESFDDGRGWAFNQKRTRAARCRGLGSFDQYGLKQEQLIEVWHVSARRLIAEYREDYFEDIEGNIVSAYVSDLSFSEDGRELIIRRSDGVERRETFPHVRDYRAEINSYVDALMDALSEEQLARLEDVDGKGDLPGDARGAVADSNDLILLLADAACRRFAPPAFDAAGLPDTARRLRALSPVTSREAARQALEACKAFGDDCGREALKDLLSTAVLAVEAATGFSSSAGEHAAEVAKRAQAVVGEGLEITDAAIELVGELTALSGRIPLPRYVEGFIEQTRDVSQLVMLRKYYRSEITLVLIDIRIGDLSEPSHQVAAESARRRKLSFEEKARQAEAKLRALSKPRNPKPPAPPGVENRERIEARNSQTPARSAHRKQKLNFAAFEKAVRNAQSERDVVAVDETYQPDSRPRRIQMAESNKQMYEEKARNAEACQSAFNSDPLSACKIDPPPCFDGGCPGSPREGPARLRVALCVTRSEAAWEGPVGPPGQPGRRRNVGIRWGS